MEVVKDIPVNKIKVIENIRIEDGNDVSLMESINQHGLQSPIKVYQSASVDEYILIFGSRRLRACKKLGWVNIKAIVTNESSELDLLILNAIENIQRIDNSPVELGRICQRLSEMGLNRKEISVRLSIPRTRVDSVIAVYNNIPEEYRNKIMLKVGGIGTKISLSTANAILQEKQAGNIPSGVVDKLFEVSYKTGLTSVDIRKIIDIIKEGNSVEKAVAVYSQYRAVTMKMIINKKDIEYVENKYGVSIGKVLRKIISGEIKENVKTL